MVNLLGATIGEQYKITGTLGEGAWGEVYQARCESLDRDVALKLLKIEVLYDDEARSRFMREAQIISKLHHKNIVGFYAFGMAFDKYPYFCTELLVGRDLQYLLSSTTLAVDEVVRIVCEVCDGLAYAHQHQVVHRDLKSQNIFITDDGSVKILDFGLARICTTEAAEQRLTREGLAIGSVLYMSPEQCAGKEATIQSDVYSLGVVLYHALAGRLPFEAAEAHAVMSMHTWKEAEPLHQLVPALSGFGDLSALVSQAMSKDPAKRFAGAAAFKQALQECRLPQVSENRSRTAHNVIKEPARRHLFRVGCVLALLLILATLTHLTGVVAAVVGFVNPPLSAGDTYSLSTWCDRSKDRRSAKALLQRAIRTLLSSPNDLSIIEVHQAQLWCRQLTRYGNDEASQRLAKEAIKKIVEVTCNLDRANRLAASIECNKAAISIALEGRGAKDTAAPLLTLNADLYMRNGNHQAGFDALIAAESIAGETPDLLNRELTYALSINSYPYAQHAGRALLNTQTKTDPTQAKITANLYLRMAILNARRGGHKAAAEQCVNAYEFAKRCTRDNHFIHTILSLRSDSVEHLGLPSKAIAVFADALKDKELAPDSALQAICAEHLSNLHAKYPRH